MVAHVVMQNQNDGENKSGAREVVHALFFFHEGVGVKVVFVLWNSVGGAAGCRCRVPLL